MLRENTLSEIRLLISRYPVLEDLEENLTCGIECMTESIQKGGKLLICGNGGSAADSLHIVGELMKGFLLERRLNDRQSETLRAEFPDEAEYYLQNLQRAIPAISLVSEVSLMTAYSNDKAADLVFAQQVLGYGKKGDVLIGISTSGNSANVLHAARISKVMGITVISLTGAGGGKLKGLSNILLDVPAKETYQVQELHLPIYHTLCLALEKELFSE